MFEKYRRIAFIGAGGKTTLSEALARAFAETEERVALTTTTHIFRPEHMRVLESPTEREILAAWEQEHLIAVCGDGVQESGTERAKMGAPGAEILRFLSRQASRLIIEADGARGRMLKLHGANEPVVPEDVQLVLIVAGMTALGQPLQAVCHRTERIGPVLGKSGEQPTTAADIADLLGAVDRSGFPHGIAILNRVTKEKDAEAVARRLWERYGIDSLMVPEIPDAGERAERLIRLFGRC